MRRAGTIACLLTLLSLEAGAGQRELSLRDQSLELPGAPSAVVAADVSGDGIGDLVVVIAFTRWGEVGIEESVEMDQVRGLVEVLTVIPALIDRRELWLFLGRAEGGFEPAARTMPIDATVLSILAGVVGAPVLALTDEGLSALRLRGSELALEPLVAERPLLAGTGAFLPNLELVHDLDGDGRNDVLLPTATGVSVYLGGPDRLAGEAASRPRFPLGALQDESRSELSRFHPLPEVEDVDGDGLPDLVLNHAAGGLGGFQVLRNLGKGRFAPPTAPLGPARADPAVPQVVHFGDLDGDGRAEYVAQEYTELAEDAGLRREMREVKRPKSRLRLHRMASDLSMENAAFQELGIEGYAFDDDGRARGDGVEQNEDGLSIGMPLGGVLDLNGDGRRDLVALTLDFSLLQVVKILTVRRIGIGLDFHVFCQQADGRFQPVAGLDLSGKIQLDLDDIAMRRHVSQFSGDFDGDGRIDFTQMGRGKTVTLHRGRPDCSYPTRPDLSLELREEPRDLALVRIRDLDGDALADLLVIQPQAVKEASVTPPVRLDLYLSRGAS